MIDMDFVKRELGEGRCVYVVSEMMRVGMRIVLLKVDGRDRIWVRVEKRGGNGVEKRGGNGVEKRGVAMLESVDFGGDGRVVEEGEFWNFLDEHRADMADYIWEKLCVGRCAYVVERDGGYVVKYDPKRPLRVVVKRGNGRLKWVDPRNVYLYDGVMMGRAIGEEEYENF